MARDLVCTRCMRFALEDTCDVLEYRAHGKRVPIVLCAWCLDDAPHLRELAARLAWMSREIVENVS